MLSHRLGHEVQSLQIQTTAVLILTLCLFLGCAHHQPSQLTTSNNQHSVLSPEIAPQPSKTMQAEQDNTVLSKKFSITGSNLPVKDIVLLMARDSALSVDIHPSIQARVTLHTQQQSMQQILDRICRQANCIYRLEVNSGILIIEPDLPILKHYKIDYVNLERDTKGGISVTNQLASTQVSLRNSPASASSNTQQNNSSTSVSTLSTHHFWKSLIKNIEEILEETDKQILIKRLEFDARLQADYAFDFEQVKQSQSKETKLSDTQKNSNENGNKNEGTNEFKDSDKKLKSYRTLFASKIIAHRESGVISIRTTHQQHEKIKQFIDLVQASANRQVLIEAAIVEITLNDEFQSGVDWTRLASGGKDAGWTFSQKLIANNLSSAPVNAIAFKQNTRFGDLAANIKFLQIFGKTKVLSSPKLMVMNN